MDRIPVDSFRLSAERTITVHRLDRCYPAQCGNKGPKLLARLRRLQVEGTTGVVSVGGAYSNHLHALAKLGGELGLATVGVVRGLDADESNATLADAQRWGMRLHRVDRNTYAARHSVEFDSWLGHTYPGFARVVEGGGDDVSVAACCEVAARLDIEAGETLVVPVGTGSTVAGLRNGLPREVTLCGADVVGQSARPSLGSVCLSVDASLGGYAKVTEDLLTWLSGVYCRTGILFDPLYNGKAAYWAWMHCEGSVHLLHTGGVQGWRGLLQRGLLDSHPPLIAAVSDLRF